MALALRRQRPHGWTPWWAPPQRLDPRSATLLGLLATLALVSAYLGTLLSQTLTFAAGDFGASKASQGFVLAAARIGVAATLAATVAADRIGRRRLLRSTLMVACLVMGMVAAAPALIWFGAGQTVGRGLTNAADIILLVLAVEEMPARCRAYAASILALVGGLGSGMVVWLLPLADLGRGGWRLIYLPPLVFLPIVAWAGRQLPESRRFLAAEAHAMERGATRPRFEGATRQRLALLAGAAFLLLLFATPASQFRNEFLRDERGFSAARVAAFTLVSGTPAGLGVWLGGRLAETIGRRRVGAGGLVGGGVLVAISYLSHGWALWSASVAGTVLAATTIPAMRVYGAELFPTRLRGRANGITNVAAVAGSVVGVLVVGGLAGHWEGLGRPIALLALGPLVVAALVVTVYPETADRTLEDLNPTDTGPVEVATPTTPPVSVDRPDVLPG
jgi:MFS family permease